MNKGEIIANFALKENDTGSPEVQIALLTHQINNVAAHLKQNKKDLHGQYGLIKQVSKRKRLLSYLKKKSLARYTTVINNLQLRK